MIPPSTCQPWQTDRSGPMPESTVTTPSYTTPWDTILNEALEKSDNPAIRNHPKKSLMQTFLLPYADAQKARRFLKKRWEDDRLKKGNFTLKFEQKLVVSDFMVLSEKAYVWDLIDYLKMKG